MPQEDLTRRRLGGFYFFYFAYLGAYTPFFTLYLLWIGRSAVEIGMLMALPAVARIVAPHLWGWLAEVAGRQTPLLRATTAASVVCFFGVFAGNGFHWLFAVLLLASSAGRVPAAVDVALSLALLAAFASVAFVKSATRPISDTEKEPGGA